MIPAVFGTGVLDLNQSAALMRRLLFEATGDARCCDFAVGKILNLFVAIESVGAAEGASEIEIEILSET